jgi:hypothetical protein
MWDVLCLDAFLLLMELDWCRTLKGSWGEDRDVNQSCLRLLAASCCCFFIWFADIFGCMMLLSAFALRQFRGSSCQIRHASCVRDGFFGPLFSVSSHNCYLANCAQHSWWVALAKKQMFDAIFEFGCVIISSMMKIALILSRWL